MITSTIDDHLNTEIAHEHGFFEDGSGENTGFFGDNGIWNKPGVIREDDPSLLQKYEMFGPHYDDDLIREAKENVDAGMGNYNILLNNCQDYADRLRQEYERLRRQREEQRTPCN